MGYRLHAPGAGRLWLSRAAARYRPHGRDPGQRHGRRAALSHFSARAFSRIRPRTGGKLPALRRCRKPCAARLPRELHQRMGARLPEITEDTMPGELANCIAGRIANIFNFHGPNFVTDAACASAMAALTAAVEGLIEKDFDVAVTGGIDRNMGAPTFVKFCKIGALSGTGTRPYADGADGFVMGEGAVIFLLKRLADAERDGDKIYAVLRGIGASSDGKGKGITAPNPAGQKLCIRRAWENAGLSPATATLIEGHGTSTRVGDVVEVESFTEVLSGFHVPAGTVALGSVKSNIGHLKGAAGAAGLLKTALALRDKLLPPSVHCEHPNPNIDFVHSPLYVNGELRPWTEAADGVRRAGVSAFGFGGTNFHAVLEEYIPHRLTGNGKTSRSGTSREPTARSALSAPRQSRHCAAPRCSAPAPLRPNSPSACSALQKARGRRTRAGHRCRPPKRTCARRSASPSITRDAAELADKSAKALKALRSQSTGGLESAARARHLPRPSARRPKWRSSIPARARNIVNMLRALRAAEPIVARDLRGSRPRHDAAARQAAERFHFRGSGGCQRRGQSRRRSAPDRHHAAGRAGSRSGPDAPARGLRHSARYDHGPQPGRIRRAGGRRRPAVRGRPGSRERARPRNDARLDGR